MMREMLSRKRPRLGIGMPHVRLSSYVSPLLVAMLTMVIQGQEANRPEFAEDFELRNWRTGDLISRSDFEGEILVLDFFAWWCGPCRHSSPDLKENVEGHYQARGGTNPFGVPVRVLPVNVEQNARQALDRSRSLYSIMPSCRSI